MNPGKVDAEGYAIDENGDRIYLMGLPVKFAETLSGTPLLFYMPPVPTAGNQPVCPLCQVGCVYKPDEIECVHGHKFRWIQAPPWTDPSRRFYPAISNEHCLDYWLMSRWGMI